MINFDAQLKELAVNIINKIEKISYVFCFYHLECELQNDCWICNNQKQRPKHQCQERLLFICENDMVSYDENH
jgi:hypothetical protein